MDFDRFLREEVRVFLENNCQADVARFLLKKSPFQDITVQELAQQIKGMQVAAKKLPFLSENNILFPPALNLEQSSSQVTAQYKANLVSGKTMVDLTSGFGIDAFFLSKNFESTTLVEQNEELMNLVQHNWRVLNIPAEFINYSCEEFLNRENHFDLIFLDPARRTAHKRKVFLLEDLSPNILEIQDQLLQKAENVLIKLSPLIDLSSLVQSVKNIAEVHLVAVKNDVKEVVVSLQRNYTGSIHVVCVNLESGEPDFHFQWNDEKNATAEFSDFELFLYIPNGSVLKSGSFNLISEKLGLKKLEKNTHLYTSAFEISEFPGRVLEMEKISAKEIKKGSHFNIISKNHPLKPDEIKKKYSIKDGGSQYLIFTKDLSGSIILKSK